MTEYSIYSMYCQLQHNIKFALDCIVLFTIPLQQQRNRQQFFTLIWSGEGAGGRLLHVVTWGGGRLVGGLLCRGQRACVGEGTSESNRAR